METPSRLTAFFDQPGSVGLDEALLTLAGERPGAQVDIAARLAELDRWADAIEAPTVDALRVLVYDRLDFRGDNDDYHDARNSLFDEVLQRRTGMPITLAAVMVSLARRAGISLHAVGMPGHFLLHDPVAGEYLDPFDRARPQPMPVLHQRMAMVGVEPDARHLATVDDHHIVFRVINNLTNTYVQREARGLDWLLDLRLQLPLTYQDPRVLIALCEQRGRFNDAAQLLERSADSTDGDGPQRRAHALRARLN